MLDTALLHEVSELLAKSFSADEINYLGKLIDPRYDNHRLSGTKNHITISDHKAAVTLVDHCIELKKDTALVQLVIQMDEASIQGRTVRIEGLEDFLYRMSLTGIVYDFKKRKLMDNQHDKEEMENWGALKNDRIYPITIMSLDIVGNSALVRRHGTRKMEKVYFRLKQFLKTRIRFYDGRIWNFAGDGGIIAFTFKGHEQRAVNCALDIQKTLPLFLATEELPVKDQIRLRLGLDTGKQKFRNDTGAMVSDVINYAAHLEKGISEPGKVAVSETILKSVNKKTKGLFAITGEFEGRHYGLLPDEIDQPIA
jgi:class 3 adenylate cyclase